MARIGSLLLCLELCKLVVIITLVWPENRPKGSIGAVTVRIHQIMCERTMYDYDEQQLVLEVEMGGRSETRDVVEGRLLQPFFSFYPVTFDGAMMFRVRDNLTSPQAIRAIYLLSAADATSRTSVFKADRLNTMVMQIEWTEIKESLFA